MRCGQRTGGSSSKARRRARERSRARRPALATARRGAEGRSAAPSRHGPDGVLAGQPLARSSGAETQGSRGARHYEAEYSAAAAAATAPVPCTAPRRDAGLRLEGQWPLPGCARGGFRARGRQERASHSRLSGVPGRPTSLCTPQGRAQTAPRARSDGQPARLASSPPARSSPDPLKYVQGRLDVARERRCCADSLLLLLLLGTQAKRQTLRRLREGAAMATVPSILALLHRAAS